MSVYYIRLDLSQPDHELDKSGQGEYSDWKDFSYDTNYRYFNWGHTYTGASYHQLARINELSFWHGFAFNQLASLTWEYAIEYREVFSIGDQILTGFGGSSLGEAMFQIAPLLRKQKNWAWSSFLFDPFSSLGSARNNSIRQRVHGRFNWNTSYGQRSYSGKNVQTFSLGLDSERDRIQQYSKNNSIAYSFLTASADYTKGNFDFTTRANIVFHGFYEKTNFDRRKKYLFGIASGLEYESRLYSTYKDWFGIINLVGLAGLYQNNFAGFETRVQLAGYYDFALIDALALNKLENEINTIGIREVTRSLGYYYAKGGTIRLFSRVKKRNTSVSYEISYHFYDSIDKHNRFEQEQTLFFNFQDQIFRNVLSISHRFQRYSLGLKATFINRSGQIRSLQNSLSVSDTFNEKQLALFVNYHLK